jgi:hypothetical protein
MTRETTVQKERIRIKMEKNYKASAKLMVEHWRNEIDFIIRKADENMIQFENLQSENNDHLEALKRNKIEIIQKLEPGLNELKAMVSNEAERRNYVSMNLNLKMDKLENAQICYNNTKN